jgi:predicted lipid carrier protein YhbT
LPSLSTILACEHASAAVVALIRGTADADTLFFQRRLKIAGDTELGLIVKNWLDAAARPAWLARWQAR